MQQTQILSYGGGTQTIAMVVLVARGILPKPDCVIAADTGREMPTTWEYADAYARPLLASVGLELHIAGHDLATVDLYGHNGDLLVPAYTPTGKLSAYCSAEWKERVVHRYARRALNAKGELVNWIGFSQDERRRVKGDGDATRRYPLLELMLTRADCEHLIQEAGLPLPKKSRCYHCPHQGNRDWREVRDDPALWAAAVAIDEEIRETDTRDGRVYLHESRVPLVDADLDSSDRKEPSRQCGLGLCFV